MSLCRFEALWASFEIRSYPSSKEDCKLRTSEATDHSAIEDDLIPKIGLIWPLVHSHMKIDNKRYSINAQSPRAISTCLENEPVFTKNPPLSPVWEQFAIRTGHTTVGLVTFQLLSRGRDPRSNLAYLDLSHVPTGFWRLKPLSRVPNRVAQLRKHANISWFSTVFPEKHYLVPAVLPWNQNRFAVLTSRPQLKAKEKIHSLSWSFWAMEVFRLLRMRCDDRVRSLRCW